MLLLITPPFTQLNTPYPATAYIKGFLNTKNIPSFQTDLGIEIITALFSQKGFIDVFQRIENIQDKQFSENALRIIANQDFYIDTIDEVILFLQNKLPSLAYLIVDDSFLPEASRFAQIDDLEWAFGSMGVQDKAKHLATLYLEDIADLITECLDEHFGFSRYAERLSRAANNFDELYEHLLRPLTFIDEWLIAILDGYIKKTSPQLVGISVPFPGNLYAAFRTAQFIKKEYPTIKIVMGGGFANTELRSLSDVRVFKFFDFITLDDGEAPLLDLIEHIQGKRPVELLKRCFTLFEGRVEYMNHSLTKDFKQAEVGTPDYSDLLLDKYIAVLEIANPMHRLWSDGRWNKLTMAHGCYWGKCTFCDISLDYIKNYEPNTAKLLCDRMETLIAQTGERGFHFVDEAAPPALMRALAIEILRRKLVVVWWTNIRFEKSFTKELCTLLQASGCIAVSGGLEVASDRLLALIQKGVTVAQVAEVTHHFTDAGIMVHAYLMYGFPTQTAQETVDSLEMVRQMFELGIVQSGFWHQFAMTAHSPVGLNPEEYRVQRTSVETGKFANNDLTYTDTIGANPDLFSYGLKKSLFNYMHGLHFEMPLQYWFETKIPKTTIPKKYIENVLHQALPNLAKPSSKIIWLGGSPKVQLIPATKKNTLRHLLIFHNKKTSFDIELAANQSEWLQKTLPLLSPSNEKIYTLQELKEDYTNQNLGEFEFLWHSKTFAVLRENGLLFV